MKQITNPTELGREIKGGANETTITGDLAQRVVSIKATGGVAWAIAFGAIAIGIIFAIKGTKAGEAVPALICGGATALAGLTAATAILGLATTTAALKIGLGAGDSTVLKSLRNGYRIESKTNGRVILVKK